MDCILSQDCWTNETQQKGASFIKNFKIKQFQNKQVFKYAQLEMIVSGHPLACDKTQLA